MNGITVCVQSYNHDKYIGRCINSLVKQDFENFEIIIFDDGSTDKSLEIIQSYMDQYDFISLIKTRTPKNQTNFNIIIDHSKKFQKYFTVFHCDDFYNEKILSELFNTMEKDSNLIVCSTDGYLVNEKSEIIGNPKIDNKIKKMKKINKSKYIENLFRYGFFMLNPSFIYRSSFFIKKPIYHDFKNFGWSCDAAFFLQVSDFGDIGFTNKKLLFYRIHENSTSGSIVKNRLESNEIFKVYKYCLEKEIDKDDREIFEKMFNFRKMVDDTKINIKKKIYNIPSNFKNISLLGNVKYSISTFYNFKIFIGCFIIKYTHIFFPKNIFCKLAKKFIWI